MNRPTTDKEVAVYGMIFKSSLVVTMKTIHTPQIIIYSHFMISLSFVTFNLILIEHSGSYISEPDPDLDPDLDP